MGAHPMKRSTLNLANQRAVEDIRNSFTDMYTPNSWRQTLKAWAARGYPTGNDGAGGGTGINRPTERIALAPLEEPAAKLKRADEIARQMRALARELNSIRLYTITPAKYDGPEPRACVMLECTHTITMIGNDVARHGMCAACYQREYRKQKAGHPNRIDGSEPLHKQRA